MSGPHTGLQRPTLIMPDASHDFGAHLRLAREQRGVSLREIAARTKISVLALEALERNDISRLPGGIFTRAFVRSYASEVGLDPEDTVRRFLARFPDESTEESPKAYEPNPEHISVDEPPTFGRAWRAVAWSIPLLLVVGYFGFGGRLPWWGDRPHQQARTADVPTPPPPPPALAAQPSAPADTTGAVHTPPTTEPGRGDQTPPAADAATQPAGAQQGTVPVVPAPSATVGAPAAATRPQTAEPAAAPSTAARPPAAVPADQKAGGDTSSTAGAFRLTLAPREACWVSVRANGASVFSGLMRAGDRQDLAVHGDVSLTVGNAGAFVYYINDQPGRSLGGPGQVTTVRLNADNVKTFIEPR